MSELASFMEANSVIQSYLQTQVQSLETFQGLIDSRDEMYLFALENAGGDRELAVLRYFMNGRRIFDSVEQIIHWYFQGFEQVNDFLDFASGYGRFTRFLLSALPPEKVWVSDIYQEAVDFQTQQFGVTGVYSTSSPTDYVLNQPFDCILASSFFSHIPEHTFTQWLEQLYSLLSERGILIFSVHDVSLAPPSVISNDYGFYFVPESESLSLDTQEYGTTYISEAFLGRIIGKIAQENAHFYRIPKGLCNHQDLYLITKDTTRDFGSLNFSYHPEGKLTTCQTQPSGDTVFQGWVTSVSLVSNIQVWVNQSLVQHCLPSTHSANPESLDWCCLLSSHQASAEDIVILKAINDQGLERILAMGTLEKLQRDLNLDQTPKITLKPAIFSIIGMHRSGTSLMASLLQDAGVHLGETLVGEDIGNEKGHFEDLEFVEWHKNVLRSQSLDLDGLTLQSDITIVEPYRNAAQELINKKQVRSVWGWKDPRTTLFLEFWQKLLPETKFLLVFRAPWEVVDSLYRRGSDELFQAYPEKAVEVWIHYNQKMLEFYEKYPDHCLLLSLDQIIANPQEFITRINDKFALNLSAPSPDIIDLSLLGNEVGKTHRPQLIDQQFPDAIALYHKLCLKANIQPPTLPENFNQQFWGFRDWLELGKAKRDYKQEQNRLKLELQHITSQLHNTQTQLEETHLKIHQVYTEASQINNTLTEVYKQLEQKQTELAQLRSQLTQTQQQLTESLSQLQRTQGIITAMQTSKFWKLRNRWFHLKRWLGLKVEETVE